MMETEGKSKFVASVRGANFFQFLASLAVLHWLSWKKWMNSTVSFKSTMTKQLKRGKDWTNVAPQTGVTTFSLTSVLIILLWSRVTATSLVYTTSYEPTKIVGDVSTVTKLYQWFVQYVVISVGIILGYQQIIFSIDQYQNYRGLSCLGKQFSYTWITV